MTKIQTLIFKVILVVFGFLGVIILALILIPLNKVEFESLADPANSDLRTKLPLFVIPQADIDAGNGIQAAFVKIRSSKEWDLTVIFHDEDHPSFIIDFLYDQFRARGKYHRQADVETMKLFFDDQGNLAEIDFTNVYSKEQLFYEKDIVHYDARISADKFSRDSKSDRPVIYINTWNHMFSEKNNNPERTDLITIGDYPLYSGSREDVEGFYRKPKN